MNGDQIFMIILELIKAAGAIVPAVLNFFKHRQNSKDSQNKK